MRKDDKITLVDLLKFLRFEFLDDDGVRYCLGIILMIILLALILTNSSVEHYVREKLSNHVSVEGMYVPEEVLMDADVIKAKVQLDISKQKFEEAVLRAKDKLNK